VDPESLKADVRLLLKGGLAMADDGLPVFIFIALALGIVLFVALVWFLVHRTRTTNQQTEMTNVKVHGASATTKFEWGKDVEALLAKINTLVRNNPRYKTMTETPSGAEIQIKGSFWSWGEVIYLSFQRDAQPLQVVAECRPRVKTTVYDYGQCGKDLAEFVEQIA
jgi:hypothetical protein